MTPTFEKTESQASAVDSHDVQAVSAEALARLTLLCNDKGEVTSIHTVDTTDRQPTGKIWHQVYWFDHLDFDHREAGKLQKAALSGTRGETRVWVRVSDHQLVRADLHIEPLHTSVHPTGGPVQLLIRTEPTVTGQRRKPGATIETKSILPDPKASNATATQVPDILQQRLPIAMLRVDLSSGKITAINDPLADLLGGRGCIAQPLAEQVVGKDQSNLTKAVSQLSVGAISDFLLDTQLKNDGGAFVRLSLVAEPDRKTALGVIRDLSHERGMIDLIRKADQLTELSRRGDLTLRRLEELVACCPVGLAIFQGGKSVLKNKPLRQLEDANQFDQASLQKAISSGVSSTIQPQKPGHARLFVFPIDLGEAETDVPLLGVAAIPPELVRPSQGVLQLIHQSLETLPFAAAVVQSSPTVNTIEFANSHYELDQQGLALSIPLDDTRQLKLIPPLTARSALHERTSDLLDTLPQPTVLVDRQLRVSYANPAATALIGLGAVAGQALSDLFVDASTDFEQTLANPISLYRTRQGREIETSVHRMGEAAVLLLSDPIPRRLLDESAARGVLLSKAIASLTPTIGVIEWDVQDGKTALSAAALELLGHPPQATVTWSSAFNHVDDDDKARLESGVYVLLDDPEARPFRLRLSCRGKRLDLVGVLEWSPPRADVSMPRRLLMLVSDTTASLEAQTQLEQLGKRLVERNAAINALIEAIPGSVLVQTGDSRLYKNGDAQSLVIHKPVEQLTSGVHNVDATGNLPARTLRVELRPITHNGQALGTAAVELDETELHATRAIAATQKQLLDLLFEQSSLAIAVVDPLGRVERASAGLTTLLGRQVGPDELFDTLVRTDQDKAMLMSATAPLPVAVDRVSMPGETRSVGLVILHSLAQQVSVETKLLDVESHANLLRRRLQSVEESIYDAVVVLDHSGQAIAFNRTARSLLDLDDDLTGPAEVFDRTLWRDLRKRRLTGGELPWSKVLRGQSLRGVELRARRRRDGLDWHAEVDATPVVDDAEVAAIVILRDVSIRKELEDDLELARNQLAVTSETHRARLLNRDEEVAQLIRQLRSSVQMMLPVANHLALDPRLPDDARQTGRQVLAAVQLQQRLMRLWPSSAASVEGSVTVALSEKIDVHALLHSTLRQIQSEPPIAPACVPLLELSAQQFTVLSDPAKLRQVVWNLLDAATKPADRDSPATVRTTSQDAILTIQLTDARGLHPKVLELCRQLVADEGGIFSTDSPDNSVSLTLDLASTSATKSTTDAGSTRRSNDTLPFRILFVEDDAVKMRVMSRVLLKGGYEVVGAASVEEAAKLVQSTQFDLVLATLASNARVGDSIAMMRELRQSKGLLGVAMTSEPRSAQELADAGFVDQLLRPVDLKLLEMMVDRLRATRDEKK